MNTSNIINWLLSETLHLHGVEELVIEFAHILENELKANYISLDIYTVRCKVAVRNLSWRKGHVLQAKMLTPKEAEERFRSKENICDNHDNCIVLPLHFTRGKHTHIAYASEKKRGFSPEELKALQQITPALARRLEVESYHHFYGFSGAVEKFWQRVADRCRETDKSQEAS